MERREKFHMMGPSVRRRSSPSRLLRIGGPKRTLLSSTDSYQEGTPRLRSRCEYQWKVSPSRWNVASQIICGASVRCARKYCLKRLSHGSGSSFPSNCGKPRYQAVHRVAGAGRRADYLQLVDLVEWLLEEEIKAVLKDVVNVEDVFAGQYRSDDAIRLTLPVPLRWRRRRIGANGI
jgi:hypothetical protein